MPIANGQRLKETTLPDPAISGPDAGGRTSSSQLLCCKSIDKLIAEADEPEHRLKKTLGPWSLTALGIGAIIGAGIFVLTGTAAAGEHFEAPSILHAQVLDLLVNYLRTGSSAGALMHGRPPAGPSIAISFLLVAVACSFAGLCYAELASMIPIAGSAYTYSYATLGEIFAWIIGWDLILEYVVSNVAVAVGFSGYTKAQLAAFGINLSDKWSTPVWASGKWTGAYFNLPGFLIVFILTLLLVRGVRESAEANNVMVAIKIGAIVTFLVVGGMLVHPANWHPFAPSGFGGIVTGGAIVFFTYIGFDSVSTAAEECKDPQRDLPFGIIASLVICTVLYVGVADRAAWHDEVHDFRLGPGGGCPRRLRHGTTRRASVLSLRDRGGRAHGNDLLAARLSIRPGSHLVRHVARWPAAQAFLRRASQIQNPLLVHVDRLLCRRHSRWAGRHRRRRRSFEHRHAVRLRAGLARRDLPAPPPARPSAHLPRAVRPAVSC